MPKSTRRARPSGSQSTFDGVTSRCTTSLGVDRGEGVGQLGAERRDLCGRERSAARRGVPRGSGRRSAPARRTRPRRARRRRTPGPGSGGSGRRARGPPRRSGPGRAGEAARKTFTATRRCRTGPPPRTRRPSRRGRCGGPARSGRRGTEPTWAGRGGAEELTRGPYPRSPAPQLGHRYGAARGRSVGGPGGGERGAARDRRRPALRRRARAPRRGGPRAGRRHLRRAGRARRGGRRVQPLDLGRAHRRGDRRHRAAPPHRTACSAPRSSTRRRSAADDVRSDDRFGGLVARRPPRPRRVPRRADRVPRRRRGRLLPRQQGRRLHARRRAPRRATWPPTPRCSSSTPGSTRPAASCRCSRSATGWPASCTTRSRSRCSGSACGSRPATSPAPAASSRRSSPSCARSILQLRPPALELEGSCPSLAKHLDVVGRTHGLERPPRRAEPSARSAPDVEQALFRIAQEAVTNVGPPRRRPRGS